MQELSIDNYVIAALDIEAFRFCRRTVLPCFAQFDIHSISADVDRLDSLLADSITLFGGVLQSGEDEHLKKVNWIHKRFSSVLEGDSKVSDDRSTKKTDNVFEVIMNSIEEERAKKLPVKETGANEGEKNVGGSSDNAQERIRGDPSTELESSIEHTSNARKVALMDRPKLIHYEKHLGIISAMSRILESGPYNVVYADICSTVWLSNPVPLLSSLPFDFVTVGDKEPNPPLQSNALQMEKVNVGLNGKESGKAHLQTLRPPGHVALERPITLNYHEMLGASYQERFFRTQRHLKCRQDMYLRRILLQMKMQDLGEIRLKTRKNIRVRSLFGMGL